MRAVHINVNVYSYKPIMYSLTSVLTNICYYFNYPRNRITPCTGSQNVINLWKEHFASRN